MENDLVLGIDPEELAAAAAAEANAAPATDVNAASGQNPAADIANAAMMGAKPVVTTTELDGSGAESAPTLNMPGAQVSDAPVADPMANESEVLIGTTAPEVAMDGGMATLAPSADFQVGEVSTVSAAPNLSQESVENSLDDLTNFQNNGIDAATREQIQNANYNAEGPAKILNNEEIEEEPIVAAAPVPGSIGSAKSYVDIQHAEAEKAAKVKAKKGPKTKLSKNAILAIIAGVSAVVLILVGALFVISENSVEPVKPSSNNPVGSYADTHEFSTLSCRRQLAHEEFEAFKAKSGTYENIFYFKDGNLDGLVTNFSYVYANPQTAESIRNQFMKTYNIEKEGRAGREYEDEAEAPEDEAKDDSSENEKTVDEMLKHYVKLDKLTVIHGLEIKSEDIEDWLNSDAYSDRTYGANDHSAGDSESMVDPARDLDYYKTIQNKVGFTCDVVRGN